MKPGLVAAVGYGTTPYYKRGQSPHAERKLLLMAIDDAGWQEFLATFGVDSDMVVPAKGFRNRGFTQNIRWSVMMNMDKILRGETDYEDQFPDTVAGVTG